MSSFVILWINHGPIVRGISLLVLLLIIKINERRAGVDKKCRSIFILKCVAFLFSSKLTFLIMF